MLFIVANFAYQASLIYYDATLKTVSQPESRGMLSGIGVAVGYLGTIAVGLAIFFLDVPVPDRFRLSAVMFALFAIPIFVFVKEEPRPAAISRARRHRLVRPALPRRSSTHAACPASGASSSAGSSIRMRSTR